MHFVILHGLGCDTDDVAALADLLHAAGHEVLAPDLPELRTDARPPDPARVAARVVALARSGAVWVGNSYGAHVAAAACSLTAVRALVVLGAVVRVAVPTLVLVGEDDVDIDGAQRIAGAGHLVQRDQPEAVASRVLHWLPSLDAC